MNIIATTAFFLDANECTHPEIGSRVSADTGYAFGVMMIPDWCPLPAYTEQVESMINMAVTFGKK